MAPVASFPGSLPPPVLTHTTAACRAETPLNESHSEAEVKAKKYYISCLDANQTVEDLGAQPLLDLIHKQFSGWTVNWDVNTLDFQSMLEKIHALGMSSFYYFLVGEDEKEPTKNILQVNFASLCLPLK